MFGKWKSKILCPSKLSMTRKSSVKARFPLFHVTQETLKWANANSLFPLTLKEQQCGFFYVPQESEQWKNCETGPTVFLSLSDKTRTSNHFKCPNNGRTFYSVISRLTSSVDPAGVGARDLLRFSRGLDPIMYVLSKGFVWLLTDWRIVSVADRALNKTRRKVKESISLNGPNLDVLKQQRNEGTAFTLQTAKPSRGSNDHVKIAVLSPVGHVKLMSSISNFLLTTLIQRNKNMNNTNRFACMLTLSAIYTEAWFPYDRYDRWEKKVQRSQRS